MFAALQQTYPGDIDMEVGLHIVRALTDFSDADVDPDPILLDGSTWLDARRSAQRLASDLQRHLSDLKRSEFQ